MPPTRSASLPRARQSTMAPTLSSSAGLLPVHPIRHRRSAISRPACRKPRKREFEMSWLSRVRSGIPFLPKRQTAENLWHKCSKCGTMVFVKEWEENYSVCPRCDFHDRIGPTKRFEQLFDAAEYELLPSPEVREDPLRFKDTKRYTDRLKTARSANGERDALVNARGRLDGHKVIIGVQDFAFMAGSMGIAVGAAIVAGIRTAIEDDCAYVLFTAAGGARMQEGI